MYQNSTSTLQICIRWLTSLKSTNAAMAYLRGLSLPVLPNEWSFNTNWTIFSISWIVCKVPSERSPLVSRAEDLNLLRRGQRADSRSWSADFALMLRNSHDTSNPQRCSFRKWRAQAMDHERLCNGCTRSPGSWYVQGVDRINID